MKINFNIYSKFIMNFKDLTDLEKLLKDSILNNIFNDEIIINLFFKNKNMIIPSINIIKKYRFGIFHRLPQLNIFLNIEDYLILENITNDIDKFITPVLKIDMVSENKNKLIKNSMIVFKKKKWICRYYFQIKNKYDLHSSMKDYIWIKCKFFNDNVEVLFKFINNVNILKENNINLEYFLDSIKFMGLRDDIIINTLFKVMLEQKTGITQSYYFAHKNVINNLRNICTNMEFDKNSLVRKSMDDFANI